MQCERDGVTAVLGRAACSAERGGVTAVLGRAECNAERGGVTAVLGKAECSAERGGVTAVFGLSAPSLPTPTCGHQPSCCSVIPFSIVAVLLQCDSALWLCCCSVISFSIVAILLQCDSIQCLLLWPQLFLYSLYQCRPLPLGIVVWFQTG